MSFRKTIKFNLREVSGEDKIEFEGILFTDIAFISVFINGIDLLNSDLFNASFLVFTELKYS